MTYVFDMYYCRMKFTLNIDDDLLSRAMEATGAKTKTDAIHYALREIDRRKKLVELLSTDDFGMSASDWKKTYDVNSLVEDDAPPALRVAEESPSSSGRKPRPRR